jgi:iron complex transport system substrate-binding protein
VLAQSLGCSKRLCRPLSVRACCVALLVVGVSCGRPAQAVSFSDDLGNKLTLDRVPARIVSIAPGATEMLFAAGAGHRLIATVDYSDEPLQARQIPRIGDANAIDLERLVALRPELVVVWPRGNNVSQIARLERLGIPVYRQQVDALSQLPASIIRLGDMAGTRQRAAAAASQVSARLDELKRAYAGRPELSVLLQVWDRPVYTVGGTHLVSDALRLCGARNLFEDLRGAGPAVDVEAIVARDPDLIIAVADQSTAKRWLENWRKLPSLRAVRTGRLMTMDDPRLTRLGPSVLDATEKLCRAIDRARVPKPK